MTELLLSFFNKNKECSQFDTHFNYLTNVF